MKGGIRAWNGMVATGAFEAGMAYFAPAADIEKTIILAWLMEEGSRRFYQGAAERLQTDAEAAALFRQLIDAEADHKRILLTSYEHVVGRSADPASWAQTPGMAEEEGGIMEGGVPVKEALAWLQGRDLADTLDLAMGLEVNAYDLYVKMGHKVEAEAAKQIFFDIAGKEQQHLERLGQLLDSRL